MAWCCGWKRRSPAKHSTSTCVRIRFPPIYVLYCLVGAVIREGAGAGEDGDLPRRTERQCVFRKRTCRGPSADDGRATEVRQREIAFACLRFLGVGNEKGASASLHCWDTHRGGALGGPLDANQDQRDRERRRKGSAGGRGRAGLHG